MKKTLALVLTILVTLIGTALVGIYDYNIYLNPEDKNGGTLTSKYKSYLSEKTLEINDDLSVDLNDFTLVGIIGINRKIEDKIAKKVAEKATHVYLPASWEGKKVRVILLEELDE